MKDSVNVLGTEYKILVKKYDEEEAFERRNIDGFCDSFTKTITVCDMTTCKGWENELKDVCEIAQDHTLRHEIVHAFLFESGLDSSSLRPESAWTENEEMVDWIAKQGPKIYKAWQEAGVL